MTSDLSLDLVFETVCHRRVKSEKECTLTLHIWVGITYWLILSTVHSLYQPYNSSGNFSKNMRTSPLTRLIFAWSDFREENVGWFRMDIFSRIALILKNLCGHIFANGDTRNKNKILLSYQTACSSRLTGVVLSQNHKKILSIEVICSLYIIKIIVLGTFD